MVIAVFPAEVGREAQASLLGVAGPALLVPPVRQIPAAHPLLELPEVTPQLQVLKERRRRGKEPIRLDYSCQKMNTDLSVYLCYLWDQILNTTALKTCSYEYKQV